MTYTAFLKELKQFRGLFRLEGSFIRHKQRDSGKGYCPLAAVNVARGGSDTYCVDFLPQRVCDTIACAADGELTSARRRAIRKDLLRVLGLQEVKA